MLNLPMAGAEEEGVGRSVFRPRRGCAQPDGHAKDRLRTHMESGPEHSVTAQHSVQSRWSHTWSYPDSPPGSGLPAWTLSAPTRHRRPSLPRPHRESASHGHAQAAAHTGYLLHPGGRGRYTGAVSA